MQLSIVKILKKIINLSSTKKNMKKIILGILLLMTLFSCSTEETKTQNQTNARQTAPIISPTVKIGTQVWMTKNLNVSRYSDGTPIPQVTDPTQWEGLTTGAWCYYNNDSANGITYGKLYNWFAVAGIYDAASLANPVLRKKLAPIGYHIPNLNETQLLVNNFLGGVNLAGGKLKEAGTTRWASPNTGATNSSGFTGLPGGYRYKTNGTFFELSLYGSWWISNENGLTTAILYYLSYDSNQINSTFAAKADGLSVRCIKD
jgi:uncharacterized protein (TIGR02145 family)